MKQEKGGVKKYFWDSYAIIEFIAGNPNYSIYIYDFCKNKIEFEDDKRKNC